MNRVLAFIFLIITLTSCTFNALYKDFATPSEKLSPPKFHLISIGMTKLEVASILGNPDQIIGAKEDGANIIDTWEYIRVQAVPGPDQIAERYQVIFKNGRLTSYESSGDFRQQVNVR